MNHNPEHGPTPARLAIIVPMLNEAAQLPALLDHLQHWRQRGCEVVLVDGGSEDGSPALAGARGFPVLTSARGRATQMNAGAEASQAPCLLFLHADTRLPAQADTAVLEALGTATQDGSAADASALRWGRFDVRIEGRSSWLRWVAGLMNLRSRLSGIATGDQALFMTRAAFVAVGGFPSQPLMEDVEISARLRRLQRPLCLRTPVRTSGRRWDERGPLRTIVLMWRLRLAYWRGVCPSELARRYR